MSCNIVFVLSFACLFVSACFAFLSFVKDRAIKKSLEELKKSRKEITEEAQRQQEKIQKMKEDAIKEIEILKQ